MKVLSGGSLLANTIEVDEDSGHNLGLQSLAEEERVAGCFGTVKHVISGHTLMDKTKVLKTG